MTNGHLGAAGRGFNSVFPILADSHGRFTILQGPVGQDRAVVLESPDGWENFYEAQVASDLARVRGGERAAVARLAGTLGAVRICTGQYYRGIDALTEARQNLEALHNLETDAIKRTEIAIEMALIHHNGAVLCLRSGRRDLVEGSILDCQDWLALFDRASILQARRHDLYMNHGTIRASLGLVAKELNS